MDFDQTVGSSSRRFAARPLAYIDTRRLSSGRHPLFNSFVRPAQSPSRGLGVLEAVPGDPSRTPQSFQIN